MKTRWMAWLLAASAAIATTGAVYPADPPPSPLSESYRLQTEGDFVGAQAAMLEVVEKAPRAYFPRLRLAWLQLLSVDYAAAAESYARAAALEPAAVEPLIGQQQALIALEKWDAAEKAGRDLLAKDPKNYLGISRLAWTLRMKRDFKAAAELYQRLLALYPSDAEMRIGLGYALLGAGKRHEAAEAFRAALAMVPGHADAEAGLTGSR